MDNFDELLKERAYIDAQLDTLLEIQAEIQNKVNKTYKDREKLIRLIDETPEGKQAMKEAMSDLADRKYSQAERWNEAS